MTAAPSLREPPASSSASAGGSGRRPRRTLAPWAVAAFVIAGVGVIGWHAQMSLGPLQGYDAPAHAIYADVLDRTGALPTEAETYEYSVPPAYYMVVNWVRDVADAVVTSSGSVVPGASSTWRRVLWLVIVGAGLLLLGLRPRSRASLAAGAALATFAGAWAVADALAWSANTEWGAATLVSLGWLCGLLVVSYLVARELWRDGPWTVLAVGAVAALPVTIRLGVVFHPEMQFAFFSLLALWLALRAAVRDWPLPYGVGIAAAVGAATLTRQSALVVVAGLLAGVLAVGRRRALLFATVTAASVVLVAGPWWIYQTTRFGNPIQSNLDRPGYLLSDGQPLSFYVSFPLDDLVRHPYRPAITNELLPKLHADLWSDWFGITHHYWAAPEEEHPFFASTQSVLGFGGDALAIGGLVGFGIAGLRRVAGGAPAPGDAFFGISLVVAALTFVAYVATVIRFPQIEGDPIKPSYMLHLAPLFALGGVAAAEWLWRRRAGWRVALVAWALLYAVSYGATLATSF